MSLRPAIRLLAVAVLAEAALNANGAHASNHAELLIAGRITEGGVPSHFREAVDLVSGVNKRTQQMGSGESQSGFDGLPWSAANGLVTASSLPSAAAQGRSEAWIDRRSWRLRMRKGGDQSRTIVPPGGVSVRLTFNASTGLPEEAVLQGDWGPTVYRFGDWRTLGALSYPYRREEVTSDGSRTILEIDSAKVIGAVRKGTLSRPRGVAHALPLPKGYAIVPYTGLGARQTHILVDASIDGKPARLIFDTGAANYITTDAAPAFALKISGGLNLNGTGEGSTVGGFADIGRIAIGGAVLRDETVVVGPSPFPPVKGKSAGADGLTGFEFLAGYVTTIDYPAQQLRFATSLPKTSGVRLPFYNDGFHIYVAATVDGISGLYGLDTGDGGSVTFFPEFVSHHAIGGATGKVTGVGHGLGGDVKAQKGVVDRFSFGGLNFDKLPVDFSQNRTGAFASKSIAGNLGGAVLQCFRVTIDFKHRLLQLDPAPKSPRCVPGGTVSGS